MTWCRCWCYIHLPNRTSTLPPPQRMEDWQEPMDLWQSNGEWASCATGSSSGLLPSLLRSLLPSHENICFASTCAKLVSTSEPLNCLFPLQRRFLLNTCAWISLFHYLCLKANFTILKDQAQMTFSFTETCSLSHSLALLFCSLKDAFHDARIFVLFFLCFGIASDFLEAASQLVHIASTMTYWVHPRAADFCLPLHTSLSHGWVCFHCHRWWKRLDGGCGIWSSGQRPEWPSTYRGIDFVE